MLIIGEDLGLLAPVVPQKMEEFGLLGLRVQRMPADPKDDFWSTEDYQYMTVCTPGTHDCPGLRSWLQDKKVAQKYWIQQFGRYDSGYLEPTANDYLSIVRKHLHSKSMIAMFLIQDIMAVDEKHWYTGDVTREDINHPDVAEWNWKYHMHESLEDIMESGFCEKFKEEVENSNRLV